MSNREEKNMRVKINQIENDLEHQLKRFTIICKSKGLPKPKRPECLPETPARRSGNYVSPYRTGAAAKNTSPGGSSAGRNLTNSQNRMGSGNYTPPNRRGASIGSDRSGNPT